MVNRVRGAWEGVVHTWRAEKAREGRGHRQRPAPLKLHGGVGIGGGVPAGGGGHTAEKRGEGLASCDGRRPGRQRPEAGGRERAAPRHAAWVKWSFGQGPGVLTCGAPTYSVGRRSIGIQTGLNQFKQLQIFKTFQTSTDSKRTFPCLEKLK
jgi:hypothetical protein